MKILQIAPQIPYPLVDGGKVGIFNITKHLALRGHDITLLCFQHEKHCDFTPLSKYCRVLPIPHTSKNSIGGVVRNLFEEIPYNISKYYSVSMSTHIHNLLQKKSFDIVHVDHLHMAHYGLICKKYGLPIVLREHNIESTILERYAQTVRVPLANLYLDVQHKRLLRYESRLTKEFDLCAVITNEDRIRLKNIQPLAKIEVVLGGVSSHYFFQSDSHAKKPYSMLFFGGLDWIPNQDALVWFIREIMPKIVNKYPQSKLIVVGKNVPKKIKNFESKNIQFKGFVEDLKKEVQSSQLTLAPFRIGGGIRLKILESFAMKVPVVSTSIGCEGIDCLHEKHILIGDTPEDFAKMVLRLFEDQYVYNTIVSNAYTLAERSYTWESIAEHFEKIYSKTIVDNLN